MTEAIICAEFASRYPDPMARKKYLLVDRIMSRISFEEAKRVIPFSPQSNPASFDEPGPVDVWWGKNGEHFFYITYHHGLGGAIIAMKKPHVEELTLWRALDYVSELPLAILHRIVWIKGHGNDAKAAVFFEDNNGIRKEMYRAASADDATGLVDHLKKIGFESALFVGDAEPEGIA